VGGRRQREKEKMEERGEKKIRLFNAMYSVITGMVLCSQINPTSSCTELLLNDLDGFLGKTKTSRGWRQIEVLVSS
jgi:hypothetical protein